MTQCDFYLISDGLSRLDTLEVLFAQRNHLVSSKTDQSANTYAVSNAVFDFYQLLGFNTPGKYIVPLACCK